jgi:DNA-binding transcriptional MerR regulator
MDEDLIAKKDVLEQTGISYGQLYRWKRKGLIPEAWFIRKATVTGQETFFPRDKILPRIEQIRSLKEEQSLDDLVQILAPEAAPESVKCDDPAALPPVGADGRKLLWKERGYTFAELVALACGVHALRSGVRPAEAKLLVDLLRGEEAVLRAPTGITVLLGEKTLDQAGFSVRLTVGVLGHEPVTLDRESRVKHRVDLEQITEQVKLALRGVV